LKFFPTSTREDQREYLKIRIDPIPKLKTDTDDLIRVDSLPMWMRKAFEGTPTLNVIQSKIYEKAFKSEDNILVCAPTGAGKTNIALLTIL
jgi:replicative superfamily II helicase